MALALLCVASFMAVVDTTIVSIALPSIRARRGVSPSGSQWVLNAYALVFGGLLLLFGRLGDRMGRRRLFIVGLIVFLAGSVLAGVATQAWVLLGGRIIQGLGAAVFVPSSLFTADREFRRRQCAESRPRSVRGNGRHGLCRRDGWWWTDHRTAGMAVDLFY
jgi:MFS family permease